MCGIFVRISKRAHRLLPETLITNLKARGPDSLQVCNVKTEVTNVKHATLYFTFVSSVLALRGQEVEAQPLVDETTGSVFCWNGEAWKIGEGVVDGNDGAEIFKSLLSLPLNADGSIGQVIDVFADIKGPHAFVYYDAVNLTLYYGRDRFGRRSLLHQADTTNDELTLSSIAMEEPEHELKEVAATDGTHVIDIKSNPFEISNFPPKNITINIECPPPDVASTPSNAAVSKLQSQLSASLRLRITDIPTHTYSQSTPNAVKVAVLFSGGLDCTLLARLMHDILPPLETIDLLNVAFENPRIAATQKQPNLSPYELCPDRITGRSSFHELSQTCPTRPWRFVAIDIPYSEALTHRQKIIHLMSPHNTEMDLSIAMALYFASRGSGTVTSSLISSPPAPTLESSGDYTTPSRVLLSGLGADELFAGYSRHATSFARQGYPGLISELSLDWERIGTRNLGRDDRVTSHWGREVRYPYLDEDFVECALGLPVWEKCGFRPEKMLGGRERRGWGYGEDDGKGREEEDLEPAKMVLRMMARRLDMKGVAREKKRAIQFGSRTAKMEGGRTRGIDVLS